MEDRELEALLRDIASDRVERKETSKDGDKIAQAICAFANDLPGHGQAGVLFIGARDDGSCARTPITDELLRNLGGYRDDGNIQPIPSLIVQKRSIGGCEMALVLVLPPMPHPSDTRVEYGFVLVLGAPSPRRRKSDG